MPIVICISLFSALSCNASPEPAYPFRPKEKTGAITLIYGPWGPRQNRSVPRRCLAYLGCRAAAPGIAWEPVPHKTRQESGPVKESAEKGAKDIRRATRRHFSAEDKIRIVLEGLRGEESIVEPCRREGIVQNLYYRWSKDFLEAGKKRLAGDTARAATSDEVKDLRREASALKEVVAELTLENRLLKKSVTADGEDAA